MVAVMNLQEKVREKISSAVDIEPEASCEPGVPGVHESQPPPMDEYRAGLIATDAHYARLIQAFLQAEKFADARSDIKV